MSSQDVSAAVQRAARHPTHPTSQHADTPRTSEEHLAAIRAALRAPRVVNRMVETAVGLTVAEDISATFDSPRCDNSQMDGYALNTTEGGEFPAGQPIAAGMDPDSVYVNGLGAEAAPIMTGAKIPKGTVTIVPIEACDPPHFTAVGDKVRVPAAPKGQFIRHAGSDIAAGRLLLAKGTRLNPAAVGTLAGQGVTEVLVEAPPRIVICTGGAEIGTPGIASIPDSIAPMLVAAAGAAGIDIVGHVRTDDNPLRLREQLEELITEQRPDAIVTSGGISHGKYEVVRQALPEDSWFGHVAQQPGGPQGLAMLNNTPVICLPGNPVSTLVSFRLFVAEPLGHAPAAFPARVTQPLTGLTNKDQYLRGVLGMEGCEVTATPVGGTGSHLIAQAIPATCLIKVPAGEHLEPGAQATVYPMEGYFA